jgi:hypothetical protein
MNPDSLTTFIATEKLAFMNTAATASMAWWTSSVLFSGAIIGGVWSKRNELAKWPHLRTLRTLLSVFFGSIVAYGFALLIYLEVLRRDLAHLLNAPTPFDTEIRTFQASALLGTSSFVIVLYTWLRLSIVLRDIRHVKR